MSSHLVPSPNDQMIFDEIESAVKETVRGRWFLEEYARRNRHADTKMVLGAIETLQTRLSARQPAALGALPPQGPLDRLQGDVLEMARMIARTGKEIQALQPDGLAGTRIFSASDELSAVVDTTEQATSDILAATEKMQERAWTLRENGIAIADCDLLDACATQIYTACSFQDITAQRIRKVVGTLRFLDSRIKSMLELWGIEQVEADLNETDDDSAIAPSQRPSDIWMSEAPQVEIDDTFDMFVPAAMSEPTMVEVHDWADAQEMNGAQEIEAEAAIHASDRGAESALAAPIHPAHPGLALLKTYDQMPLEERLRVFR
jgi:chemotaxis regulatin CheY-phosphate phosphatase CheZ